MRSRNRLIERLAILVLLLPLCLWALDGAISTGEPELDRRTSASPSRPDTLPAPDTSEQLAAAPDTTRRSPVDTTAAGEDPLRIPVAGIDTAQLQNTYRASRSGGRTHNAIDIMADQGTPVYAAVDGTVARLHWSDAGGHTIYQYGPDSSWVYFYAHLNRYAGELSEGEELEQGEVLGYVGDTGNAPEGVYHLHFAIWSIDSPANFWHGDVVNPYPLLQEGRRPGAAGE